MKLAQFTTTFEAAIYRRNHGGWLFVPNDGTEPTWFDAAFYSPTPIMLHGITKGKTGELVCDDRFCRERLT
ncbi:MAG: hypothetical protein ACYDHZ_10785 [Dehalococcoidia bacterium]